MKRVLGIVLAAILSASAFAAAQRTELIPSQAYTASGTSAAFSVPTAQNIMIGIDMTAGSSVSDIDLWLQASDDGGTTWYDYPADIVLTDANTAAAAGAQASASSTTSTRDIVDSYSSTTAAKWVAVYRGMAADRIRLKWIFTGTSFTFSASMVAK